MRNHCRNALMTLGTVSALFSSSCLTVVQAQTQGETPPVPPATVSAPAPEQPEEQNKPQRRRLRFGVNVGTFFPSSGKTRNRFGSSWLNFGIGVGSVRRATSRGRFAVDFSLFSRQGDDDNRAFFAPIGVEYRRALLSRSTETDKLIPYAGASANVVFADIRSDQDNVHSGFRTTVGGSIFVGTTVGESGFIQAKYLGIGKIKGFDLSGMSLTAGVRF
jgi:hypothetical protein